MAVPLRSDDIRIRPVRRARPFQVIRALEESARDESLLFGHSARRRHHPVIADDLFAALDGRELTVAGRTCRVIVYGIRDEGGRRWIQLGLDGHPTHLVTLRMSTGDGERHAVLKLASWIANPDASEDEVLHVA
jgi:hypothetical protein